MGISACSRRRSGTTASPAPRSPSCPTRRTARSAPTRPAGRARSITSSGRSTCSAALGSDAAVRAVPPAARGVLRQRADRGREGAGRRGPSRRRPSSRPRPALMLAIEYLNRFECYFLTTMADAKAYVQRGRPPELPRAVRHLPRQHRGEGPGRRDRPDRGRDPPRPHLRERPRHARQGPRALGRDVRGAARRRLRRLADDRGVRPALPALAAATKVWRDFFPSREEVYEVGIQTIRDGWAAAG